MYLLTGILRLHGSALTLLIKNGGVIVTKGSGDANANKVLIMRSFKIPGKEEKISRTVITISEKKLIR